MPCFQAGCVSCRHAMTNVRKSSGYSQVGERRVCQSHGRVGEMIGRGGRRPDPGLLVPTALSATGQDEFVGKHRINKPSDWV